MRFFSKRPYILFILPAFIFYTALVVYPIFSSFAVSLTRWNGMNEQIFVGFDNYIQLFTTTELYSQLQNAIMNNVTMILFGVFITLPLQIIVAYLIYNKVFAHNYSQVMTFSTQLISTPIILIMTTLMLDSNVGLINHIIENTLGRQYVRQWAMMPELGIFPVWLMMTFSGFGIGMLFLVGAMRMISNEMIEAAKIDGAGYWSILLKIILPQIRVTIFNLIIITYIIMMTAFEFNFVFGGGTGSGGINNIYDTQALFFFRVAFGNLGQVGGTISANSMGMGTTIATVLFAMTFILSALQIVFVYGKKMED